VPAQWLNNASELSARATAIMEPALAALARPEQVARLRRLLLALLSLWAVLALARLVWALVPGAAAPAAPPTDVINPVDDRTQVTAAREVDIERMRGWHLFGEAGAAPVAAAPQTEVARSSRDGIEKGARETRLNLKLRGIVASTEDGLGHAIIEHRNQQEVYAVEDELPVGGRVTVAKVMPRQVILDNGGTYERLVLFEESEVASPVPAPPSQRGDAGAIDKRGEAEVTAMAADYYERLYKNPQSLADVVNVSAVRRDGVLVGYRVAPGKDAQQFEQFGFKAGDLVTGVNGIALDNPANTMRLYNAMRGAEEVTFELQREEQPVTISVSLDNAGG
jgi:general secretion pathway protein C